MVICPDCEGQKFVQAFACPGNKPILISCLCCDGTGEITEEQGKLYAEEQRVQAERIADAQERRKNR